MINTLLTKYNIQRDLRKDTKEIAPVFKTDHHKGVFSLFVYPNIRLSSAKTLSLCLLSGIFLVACGGDQPRTEQDTDYYTDRSSAVFAPEAPSDPSPEFGSDTHVGASGKDQSDKNIGGWSIVLSNVGSGGMDRAKEMLRIIQSDGGLSGAYIDQRSTGLVIAYGDYLDRHDPRAVSDLERIQRIDLLGVKLFETATISPPTSDSLRGSNPSNDLRTVKERFGKRAIYTLQVGIYGRADYQMPSASDLAEFRKAAEHAARELRSSGEMAFYYHAPARSMVTIGVFSEQDFDSTTLPPTQSAELRQLRERFPNNLLNGQGINETIRTESGKITKLQSSQLVSIPVK